jgi:type II secretory pathway pseudopilin PulG
MSSRSLFRARRRLQGEDGFTLVEAMAALSILAIGIFAVAQALTTGLKTTGLSRQKLAARSALDMQMESARALNYDNLVLSDPDPGLTHSTSANNPDFWVNQTTQTFDPDGSGPLSPEPIDRVAGASPALQHYQNPLVDGSTTYTVYRYVTWVDAPTDGCVVITPQCSGSTPDQADGNADGVSDANGHDQKRVTVVITWNDLLGRGTMSLSESSLFSDGKVTYRQPAKNIPPVVSCPTVTARTIDENLTFLAQASDPDGTIAIVSWSITSTDGSVWTTDGKTVWTGSGLTPTVKFPVKDATYNVVNVATDNGGDQTSNSTLHCTVTTSDLSGNGGPDGTVKINSGATYTTNTIVSLDLSKIQSGTPTQMQLSNDGLSWSTKRTYNTSTSWTLNSGDGQKWVYVRFYDSTGKYGPAASSSIMLDSTPPAAPTNLVVSSSSTSGSNKNVTLSWTAPTDVTDLGGYRLYRRIITSTGAFTLVCDTSSTSCSDTFKKTDSYQYYVQAYDLAGNTSAQSNSVTA